LQATDNVFESCVHHVQDPEISIHTVMLCWYVMIENSTNACYYECGFAHHMLELGVIINYLKYWMLYQCALY